MNGGKNEKMLVYQDLVRHLQHMIAGKEYDHGGWLLSVQTLAARFEASRLTCLKAMRFLEVEGLVQSFPPRGFFVTPKEMRHRKIAVIYSAGETSPFFRQGIVSEETRQNCDMSAAIDYISRHGFFDPADSLRFGIQCRGDHEGLDTAGPSDQCTLKWNIGNLAHGLCGDVATIGNHRGRGDNG